MLLTRNAEKWIWGFSVSSEKLRVQRETDLGLLDLPHHQDLFSKESVQACYAAINQNIKDIAKAVCKWLPKHDILSG